MAVYTDVPRTDLDAFVSRFDIGAVLSCEPIAEGIENSNYLLTTATGRYILTLYEARVAPADLPYFVALMDHLAGCGFPCPLPVRDRSGEALHRLAGKPAAIVTFLEGTWPREPTAAHCRALGTATARLHMAGQFFALSRPNDLSVNAWRPIYTPLKEQARAFGPAFGRRVEDELAFLEEYWPHDLPEGVIHADLFPDNVFFRDGRLSGIIDFYFACTDCLVYDLAVCLNAWCFGPGGAFRPLHSAALFEGYQELRPLLPVEIDSLPVLARGAALRFLLTRLHDWFLPQGDALTRRKDPRDLLPIASFHRGVSDSAAYGIDCPA
ncbi:MAG: homoserine kinase [Rhodospirillaceae bacterium]